MLRSPREVAYLVVIAMVLGFLIARLAPAREGSAPSPTPIALASPTAATPTPPPAAPTDDPRVWDQPLVAGCVDAADAYVVSNGGGIARFDGQQWFLIDDILRTMRAATCVPGLAIAVGDGGRMVRIDSNAKTIRPDAFGTGDVDFLTVGAADASSIVAGGTDLTIWRLANGQAQQLGGGGTGLDWRAIVMRSADETWLVGDAGSIELIAGTKASDVSIKDGPDLTALAALDSDMLVGSADGRLFAVDRSHPAREAARVKGRVRAIVPARGGAYVLADGLVTYGFAAPEGLAATGLACPIVAAFGSGRGDLWVIARDGGKRGVARFDGAVWTKWGRC